VEIRLARPDEADVLGAALADALGDDPMFRWLIPASGRRDQRLLSFFTAMSSSYLQAGKPAYLADDNAGVALWSDPGTTWRLQFDLGQIRAVFGSFGTNRVVRGIRTQLQLSRLHPAEPHWYLGFLGVRGARQGQGMGGALLGEVLTKADDANVPAYVESSNARNLPFYHRHGFEIVEEVKLLGNGPRLWRMWRDTAPASTRAASAR
jgi:ribosomal protein S18 acetylase RimI-like enzyme